MSKVTKKIAARKTETKIKNADNIVFGIHAVTAFLQKSPESIHALLVQADRHDHRINELLALAQENHVRFERVNADEINQHAENQLHQGVVALCRFKESQTLSEHDLDLLLDSLDEPPFLLILDGIQDPHNLGACLRSANAAGVHAVIAPKDRAVGITPIVRKVACGAAEVTPFISVTNLARTLRVLKERGIWLYGTDDEASTNLYDANLKGPVAIILGAEGEGLRRLTREECDFLLNIPMAGTVSSLNVSVATGICLFEVVRQRDF